MRYIGSKAKLANEITEFANHLAPKSENFCDLFAGTGSVGRAFRITQNVTCNDILYFSYIINRATVTLPGEPEFSQLKQNLGIDPFEYLNSLICEQSSASASDFVFQHFSPDGHAGRMYVASDNALRIDRVRQTLSRWRALDLVSEDEWCYLLAALIVAIPSVSNIAGTYGAYLKTWDARTSRPLLLKRFGVSNSTRTHLAFNMDGLELLRDITGHTLYIDPPYNARQYSSNYHLLETVARYDAPDLKGKTGTRVDEVGSSAFCRSKEVRHAFDQVFSRAQFDNLIVSYSSEGLIPIDELIELARSYSRRGHVEVAEMPYRPYRRVADSNRPTLYEYLIGVRK